MGAFHTYDIRGIYGEEIDLPLIKKIAGACARFFSAQTYMIGHDSRIHSREMYDTLGKTLADLGKNVTGIGLCSTPQLHFFQMKQHYGVGIMVTASHNPPRYHGLKLFDDKGGSISYEKGLREIEELTGKPPVIKNGAKGVFSEKKLEDDYLDFIVRAAAKDKIKLYTVIDAANGAAGHIFRAVPERLGLAYTLINGKPDGNFPNHEPNPLLPESRRQIARVIAETKADLGVVLDGDGDRIIFCDEAGNAIENYFISALIAAELLEQKPGAAIVYDLISSKVLPDHIRKLGGRPVVSRVGYTFIYDNMVKNAALFGCETSGHVYFKVNENYYTESAAYAFVVLLKLLARKACPLSELVAPLKSRFYQAPELNLEVKDKQAVLALIEQKYGDATIGKLDGISVEYQDFWFNVRPSNTEPVLRIRLEARDKDLALAKFAELKDLITSYK